MACERAWPQGAFAIRPTGTGSRLLLPDRPNRETLREYRAHGGYAEGVSGEDLIGAIASAGLLGRGGAGFPTAVKLRTVASAAGPKYLVANGEEGEPLSIKDRWLLRVRPHLVLDGLERAADAIRASGAFVYVSDETAFRSVSQAIGERAPGSPIEVVRVARSYVSGEETSVVRAINGGPALPLDKPPRPFEHGVAGAPTLICNVEGLANLPSIATHAARGDRLLPATVMMTISGECERPGLYEWPLGAPLRDVLGMAGVRFDRVPGLLAGGYFGGLLGPEYLELRVGYEDFAAIGSGLGCGAIHVLGPQDCVMATASAIMDYFDRENARQCGPCFRGTESMSKILRDLTHGTASEQDVEKLVRWSESLRGRGACGMLDGALNLPASLFRKFRRLAAWHQRSSCARCARMRERGYSAPRLDLDDERANP